MKQLRIITHPHPILQPQSFIVKNKDIIIGSLGNCFMKNFIFLINVKITGSLFLARKHSVSINVFTKTPNFTLSKPLWYLYIINFTCAKFMRKYTKEYTALLHHYSWQKR